MPIGRSGRIVIEIDPGLKGELYAALRQDGMSLKQWFVQRATHHLRNRRQLSFDLGDAYSDSDLTVDPYAPTAKR